MNEKKLTRREAIGKAASVAALAATGTAMAAASADPYNFTNEAADVVVEGGWLTSKSGNRHMPVVTVKRDGEIVRITAVVNHPQGPMHHIDAIHIYDQDRIRLASVYPDHRQGVPEATFVLRIPENTELYAVTDCNLHGIWFVRFKV